jgi:hypothetical protein
MKKALVFALVLVAIAVAVKEASRVSAAVPPALPQGAVGCVVPKAWGQFKEVGTEAVAFEDSAGTVRLVLASSCMEGKAQALMTIARQ